MTAFRPELVSFEETISALIEARKARSTKFGFPPHGDHVPAAPFVLKILESVDAGPEGPVIQRARYVFAVQAIDKIYRDADIERPEGLSREELKAETDRAWALPVTPEPRRPYVPTYDERCGYTSQREWTGDHTYDARGLA